MPLLSFYSNFNPLAIGFFVTFPWAELVKDNVVVSEQMTTRALRPHLFYLFLLKE